jgi:RNA recognition motif-containing protein
MMDPATKQCRSFAFVTFVDKSSVDTAVKQLDGYTIRPGKKLKVNPSIPNCRLFVGNIPKSKSKEDIQQEFSKVVEGLTDVIIYNVPDDPKKKNRGFTFLDFDSHKSAAAAKKRLMTTRVFGCDIIVDWADPLEEPDEETMSKVKVLYVRNLKSDVSETMLRTAFEAHGTVEKVKKVKDYGFVHFSDRESALKALEALNGANIGDSVMQISLAKPPTDAKLKEKRKLQHMLLLGRGFNQYWGGPMMMGRMGGRGRMRLQAGRGPAYPVPPRYMDYYQGGGYDGYGGGGYMDDYCVNYGGGAGQYDEFYGYDDYESYYQMPYGSPQGRGRGRGTGYQDRGGRGGVVPYQTSSYGMLLRGGSGMMPRGGGAARGGSFMTPGGGMSSGRGGPKRKPDAPGDLKQKLNSGGAVDSWSSPPIAQQPLGQPGLDGYGDASGSAEWYQDVGFHAVGGGQQWHHQ